MVKEIFGEVWIVEQFRDASLQIACAHLEEGFDQLAERGTEQAQEQVNEDNSDGNFEKG